MPNKQTRVRNGVKHTYWAVGYRTEEGKRSNKTFKTKVEALKFENHIKNYGKPPDADKRKKAITVKSIPIPKGQAKHLKIAGTTFGDLHTRYRDDSIIGRDGNNPWRKSTIQRFDDDTARLYRHMNEYTPIGALDLAFCRTLRDTLIQNLSRAMAIAVFGHFKAILNYAVLTEKLSSSPAQGLSIKRDRLKQKKATMTIYSSEQVRQFITHTTKSRWRHRLLPRLLHETGMRVGEARALTWDNVDFDHKVVSITCAVNRHQREIDDVKSYESFRRIRISDEMVQDLEALRERGLSHYVLSEGGKIHSYRNLLSRYHKLQTEANLPCVGFHAARHFCASRMIASGCSALVLRKHLGHDSVETTLKIYGHLFEEKEALSETPVNLGLF